jgi:hypothetical protein
MNQAYLIVERPVAACGGWDVGGRVDLLYGTDYYFTTAAGLETMPPPPTPRILGNSATRNFKDCYRRVLRSGCRSSRIC